MKGVQIGTIDDHATQRLALTLAFPRSQRRHVNYMNEALQNLISHRPKAAPKVCGRLAHVQYTRRDALG